MKVIKPTPFVAATHLVSSTATEAYSTYNAATVYAAGPKVVYLTKIYESLLSSNVGNTPSTSPVHWVLLGPDNKHAMFDDQISTATIEPSTLTVVLDTGMANSFAVLGLLGGQITVDVTNGAAGPSIYSQTVDLDGSYVYDWYMYFFEPFTQIGEVVLTDIPPYPDARLTFNLSGGGDVQVGQCIFGTFYELGDAEYGATSGITDYSRKETDEFGMTTFVQRAYSKRMSLRMMLDAGQMNKVQRILADIRATPSVFIGAEGEDYLPLVVYGFYRDFQIEVAYPTKSYCSLEVEGLI